MFKAARCPSLFAALGLTIAAGCQGPDAGPGPDEVIDTDDALVATNGLSVINGLSVRNGLSTITGLSTTTGLMTTAEGRKTVEYLVRCALPSTRKITKAYAGVTYTFAGGIGVAPEWETGSCGTACQEWISACMLAHVNTKGQHIGLWMVGSNPALGWGYTSDYPFQEGSFFGNIFVDPPVANYC